MIRFIHNLQKQIRTNRRNFIVYSCLRIAVILILLRTLISHNWEASFICVFSLVLLLAPAFIETNFHIDIPSSLEISVYLFIFAAEILGELGHFYEHFFWWDTMLHTLNGFGCAAVGFGLIDLLNEKSRSLKLSPIYLSLVAFCFSMTVGVLWEFAEYSIDHLSRSSDMQRDVVVTDFASRFFDENGRKPVHIGPVISTEIHTDVETLVVQGGYLDIGINDTIKDLFVNFIGAIVFSIAGYWYVRARMNRRLIHSIVPTRLPNDSSSGSSPSDIHKEARSHV